MAEFCAFSWWWLVPLTIMLLFAVACFLMPARRDCCMPGKADHS